MNTDGSYSIQELGGKGSLQRFRCHLKVLWVPEQQAGWHLNQLGSCFRCCLVGNHLVGHWFRSISFLFVWSSAWACFSLLSPSAIAVKVKPNPRPWQSQWSWVSGFLVGLFGIHTRKRLDFPEKESLFEPLLQALPLPSSHPRLSLMHFLPLMHIDFN